MSGFIVCPVLYKLPVPILASRYFHDNMSPLTDSSNQLVVRPLVLLLLLLCAVCVATGSKLPKFVDQQLNNQANEMIVDVLIPLQSIRCFERQPINCFRMNKFPRSDLQSNWEFVEFQVSSHPSATEHRFKLLAYSRSPDSINRESLIFESATVRPDPILMDIIIDISVARETLLRQTGTVHFLLACVDCDQNPVRANSDDGIGFVIIKNRANQRRSRRSIVRNSDCTNGNSIVGCCLQKVLVEKSVIFENSSMIVAPNTVPVTYCRGTCYVDMFLGNHNLALLRYHEYLSDGERSKISSHFPCCSARDFRDLDILYALPNGGHEMAKSKSLMIESCKCV